MYILHLVLKSEVTQSSVVTSYNSIKQPWSCVWKWNDNYQL